MHSKITENLRLVQIILVPKTEAAVGIRNNMMMYVHMYMFNMPENTSWDNTEL